MVIIDGHAHIYPHYDLCRALDCLVGNMRRLAPPGDTPPVLLACLAERSVDAMFAGVELPVHAGYYEISAGPERGCLAVKNNGDFAAWLVMGRQFVTAERLEVLGLGLTGGAVDGWERLPAAEIIRNIRAADGISVLPWAPGKWFFGRGRRVADLVRSAGPGELLLGDTTLRPRGWPLPGIMRTGTARGVYWLPGSDPLPLPREERWLGSYGAVYNGDFDACRPLTSLRNILRNHGGDWRPVGRRGSFPATIRRLALLKFSR